MFSPSQKDGSNKPSVILGIGPDLNVLGSLWQAGNEPTTDLRIFLDRSGRIWGCSEAALVGRRYHSCSVRSMGLVCWYSCWPTPVDREYHQLNKEPDLFLRWIESVTTILHRKSSRCYWNKKFLKLGPKWGKISKTVVGGCEMNLVKDRVIRSWPVVT